MTINTVTTNHIHTIIVPHLFPYNLMLHLSQHILNIPHILMYPIPVQKAIYLKNVSLKHPVQEAVGLVSNYCCLIPQQVTAVMEQHFKFIHANWNLVPFTAIGDDGVSGVLVLFREEGEEEVL